MMSGRTPKLTYLVILFLVVFSGLLEAANLKERKTPQGDLGIGLDYQFALNDGEPRTRADRSFRWLFSTYLEFNEPVSSITAPQLQQMAIDAHEEMRKDILRYDVRVNKAGAPDVLPTVMTILAFENKIILSSSQKGRSGFISNLPDSPVKDALNFCQAAFAIGSYETKSPPEAGENPDHMYDRKCGEIYAFHQYYQINTKDMKELQPKARVLAVGMKRFTLPAEYKAPCGSDEKSRWGCDLTVQQVGAEVVKDEGTSSYDLATLAGGVKARGQIQSCERNRIIWLRR